MRRFLYSTLFFIVPLVFAHGFSLPHPNALAIFISITLLWFTEWVPLAVTGPLVPILSILYGVVGVNKAFLPFGNQIIFLFLGSFLLAAAFQKHQLDRRMAYSILKNPLAKSPFEMILVISMVSWFLSMWISNTAACVIMTPITQGVAQTLLPYLKSDKARADLKLRLLFTVAFSASIGGMATPVGSPPNLMAMQFLSDQGVTLDFFQWIIWASPISLLMLLALNFLLAKLFPSEKVPLHEVRGLFAKEYHALGKMNLAQKQVLIVFCSAIALWILPGLLKALLPTNDFVLMLTQRFPMGMVAVLAAFCLYLLPVEDKTNLELKDLLSIDWGTILLFGGGLCLGQLLDQSGLGTSMGKALFSVSQSWQVTGVLAIIAGILLSEFGSNTASASLLIPILMGGAVSLDESMKLTLVLAATFAASFGFMLPVSTPPNAIIYATGEIKLKEMVKTGIYFDIIGALLIVFVVLLVYPLLGVV